MARRVAYQTAAVVGLAITLAGCGFGFSGFEQRAAWRDREERACMSSRPPVVFSAWVQPEREINGRGACGILYPLKVSALENGTIKVGPSAMLDCPMTTMLEDWFRTAVQPAAMAWFGLPVVEIKQLSNYACRSIDSIPGKKLSEHAFGNAIDIAAFKLANGRKVTVKRGWRGAPTSRASCARSRPPPARPSRRRSALASRITAIISISTLPITASSGVGRYCNPKPQVQPPHRRPMAVACSPGRTSTGCAPARSRPTPANRWTRARRTSPPRGRSVRGVRPQRALTAPPAYAGN